MTDITMDEEYNCITVTPILGGLGAIIEEIDISEYIGEEVILDIKKALLKYLVVFFHNQKITPHKLLSFSKRFGIPIEYPLLKGIPESKMITQVKKLENETINFGGVWHTDMSYLEKPAMSTMLHAIEIPPFGGDTLFSNQYLAYEALSCSFKNTLQGLVAVNTSTNINSGRTRQARMDETGAELKVLMGKHPVIRTHPETGKKSLYVDKGHTSYFDGWTEEESKPLLDFLFYHQIRPEFTCRFKWKLNSIAFWDNRCTLHYPLNDYQGYRRIMHRIILEGDQPV